MIDLVICVTPRCKIFGRKKIDGVFTDRLCKTVQSYFHSVLSPDYAITLLRCDLTSEFLVSPLTRQVSF